MVSAQIKTMSAEDVEMAVTWAANEGWNPGLSDASLFRVADPTGFFISQHANEPIATLSAVRYGQSFGFIGLYIVQPIFRGKGYGWEIWNAGMQYLEGRTIGLDGVISQQDNYRKCGFVLHHRNIRFEGLAQSAHENLNTQSHTIVPLSQISFQTINEYDRSFFPDDRSVFLSNWISQANSYALGSADMQALTGYGVIRQCKVGYKIGPLFADTEAKAEALYHALCSKVPAGSPIYLDVPECNKSALSLAQRNGLKPVFETARMYRGEVGNTRLDETYGITSFELG